MIDTEKRNTIRLGFFVLVGMIILIISVYLIGSKKNMFTSTFRIAAVFNDVNGLQGGNSVRFHGIDIGTVKEVDVVSDSSVKVTMIIQNKMKPFLKKNAIASVGTDGLMGNKIVIIKNGDSASNAIAENDVLKTLKPIDADAEMRKLGATNANVKAITDDLSELMDRIKNGEGVIGELMKDSGLVKDLHKSIKNIISGSGNFNEDMEALKHNILFRSYFKKKEKEKEKK